jgi:hypothetical protein
MGLSSVASLSIDSHPDTKIVALQGFSHEVIPFVVDNNSVAQEVQVAIPKIKSILKHKLAE